MRVLTASVISVPSREPQPESTTATLGATFMYSPHKSAILPKSQTRVQGSGRRFVVGEINHGFTFMNESPIAAVVTDWDQTSEA